MAILRAEQVQFYYGGSRALDSITLDFPSSGIVSLIGPNGAGKSTLFNVLSGLSKPTRGSVWLGGRDISRVRFAGRVRLGIGRTFQSARVAAEMSVRDHLLLATQHPGARDSLTPGAGNSVRGVLSAEHWARRTGIPGELDRMAGDLSFGQKKLLNLACCMAGAPSIFLLDEPAAGLDLGSSERVVGLITEAAKHGNLVVFIEHDFNLVQRCADLVVAMAGGQILTTGAPEAVLSAERVIEAFAR